MYEKKWRDKEKQKQADMEKRKKKRQEKEERDKAIEQRKFEVYVQKKEEGNYTTYYLFKSTLILSVHV